MVVIALSVLTILEKTKTRTETNPMVVGGHYTAYDIDGNKYFIEFTEVDKDGVLWTVKVNGNPIKIAPVITPMIISNGLILEAYFDSDQNPCVKVIGTARYRERHA